MRATAKDNFAVIANLKKTVDGVAKAAYGEFVANVLTEVINETVMDSRRAAANWNLSFGYLEHINTGLDPKEYGQVYNGGPGRVGFRKRKELSGDETTKQKQDGEVAKYKGFYYGYSAYGTDRGKLTPGGELYNQLGIGKPVKPKTVTLYNPVPGTRKYSYRDNAFKMTGNNPVAWAGISNKIQGRIPKIIMEMAQETRFPHTSKK